MHSSRNRLGWLCILQGFAFAGDIDGMKNSPANGPGTPRDDLPPVSGAVTADMGGYPSLGYQDNVSQMNL